MPLVIVHDFNVVSIPVPPNETQTPLIVYPNAVLALPVPTQRFQSIAGRRRQVPQFRGAVQLPKFAPRYAFNYLKAPDWLPMVKALAFVAPERPDHIIHRIMHGV
jgi:hypothetical protein